MQENLTQTQNLANEWLTSQQLANEIGLTISQQNKLRMKRKDIDGAIKPIPYLKVGRNVLYNRAKINEWLLENQVMN